MIRPFLALYMGGMGSEDTNFHAEVYRRMGYGQVVEDGPAALPPGTRIRVEELFAKVPARRKFLRSARSEYAACLDVVRRLAMARPDIAVTLETLAEGAKRTVLSLQAGEELATRVARIIAHELKDKDKPSLKAVNVLTAAAPAREPWATPEGIVVATSHDASALDGVTRIEGRLVYLLSLARLLGSDLPGRFEFD